jgi:hypothetical protein
MSSLCSAVNSQIDDILQGEPVSNREVRPDGPDQCSIITEEFVITFYRDNRGGLITSTIRYLDISEFFRENIPFYTIREIFPIYSYDCSEKITRSPYKIQEEIENVKVVLKGIRDNNISSRDIFFFFMGHCEGYSRAREYIE